MRSIASYLLQFLGVALLLAGLLDVFLTVLFARSGIGVISPWLGPNLWRAFKYATAPLKKDPRAQLLAFCGPVLLVLQVSIWLGLLAVGSACLLQPLLGSAIVASDGPTPTDFLSALALTGSYASTATIADLVPKTATVRAFLTVESLFGAATLTLTITWFLQVYNALLKRNVLALSLHHASAGTGDAARLLAGLGATDDFSAANRELSDLAAEFVTLYESHHFYPALLFFRFKQPYYAAARLGLLMLDLATLVKTALNAQKHAALQHSSAVSQLWGAGFQLLQDTVHTFVPDDNALSHPPPPDEKALNAWKSRYHRACQTLRAAGISTTVDERAGAIEYANLRKEWDPIVMAFARFMCHAPQDIDPAGQAE